MHKLFSFLVVLVVASREPVKTFEIKNVISAEYSQVTGASYS